MRINFGIRRVSHGDKQPFYSSSSAATFSESLRPRAVSVQSVAHDEGRATQQTSSVFLAWKSPHIIFSISDNGLLRCSLDSFSKGKCGICVYRYKDCKVDDVREFISALVFVDITKPPISDMNRMIDQIFGAIAKSTTNTSRFPKTVDTISLVR
jgi:hypothetical protein